LDSLTYVQNTFRDYYANNFSLQSALQMIEKREFGFASFDGWMLRHRSFKTKNELTMFLQDFAPHDAYFSCAYYEEPEAEMERKGWLGADLVFDIDADHIPTQCSKIHDEWTCGNCAFSGKGITPEKCPKCGNERFDTRTWPCEVCLDSAKTETVKLLDFLMRDFGFSDKEIRVFFSGHRGYHIHVENEAARSLNSMARKEIVDYVTGLGLDITYFGLSDRKILQGPSTKDQGWRGRIARSAYDFVRNANEDDYKNAGLQTNVELLIRNKKALLKSLDGVGTWSTVKGVAFGTWKRLVEHSIGSISAKVDTAVTTDVHRLIRLADTLHGKTGLKKVEFALSAVSTFDPFKSAIAFKAGTAKVIVSDAPKFRLDNEIFGPYKCKKIELPTAAALLLVCKGRAKVVE